MYAFALAGVLSFSLLGCSSNGSSTKTDTTTETTDSQTSSTSAATESSTAETATASADYSLIKDGVLTVGMEVGYPPLESYDTDGKTPIGFDVDVIKDIAGKMGLEVEFVDTAWDGIFAGLDTKKYDCIISGVTITDERKQKYDFSDAYIQNYQCMVILKDSKVTATSPEEATGLKVGYQAETTSDVYMTDLVDKGLKIEASEYEKILEAFTDLEAGRTDAVVCDSTVATAYLNKENSKFKLVWKQQDSPEEFGIMVQKGNTMLTDINKYLKELKNDGTIESLTNKWFG